MRPFFCIDAENVFIMKKISFFITAFFIGTTLFAQDPAKFGLKAGLNLSKWDVENKSSDDFGTLTGFHIGGLAHIHLSDHIAFQPEIQFSTQGAEDNFSGNDIEFRTRHINIPLMFQYMFNNGFRIEAGPQVGFLLSADDKLPNGDEIDSKSEYKKTDFALGIGLNYLTYSGFGIGGRYNFGLSNIDDDNTRVNDTYNRVLQLSVFYMFDSRHKAKSR